MLFNNSLFKIYFKLLNLIFLLKSFGGNGVLVCSIDNMPTQLPREATEFFGSLLLPHLEEMVIKNDFFNYFFLK